MMSNDVNGDSDSTGRFQEKVSTHLKNVVYTPQTLCVQFIPPADGLPIPFEIAGLTFIFQGNRLSCTCALTIPIGSMWRNSVKSC